MAFKLSNDIDHDLIRCVQEARLWLFEGAAPIWASRGRLRSGAFAEYIEADGTPSDKPYRMRVLARQIYAYSELGKLGWTGDWQSCVETATNILIGKGRRRDGFFVHSLDIDGEICDPRADLYDHAFVMFSLAHAGDVLARQEFLDVAEQTMILIERSWRHPAGGFREGEIDGPPRRQNPHMHMFEACKAMWDVTGALCWKERVSELASLCLRHFIEVKVSALTEYFDDDWTRLGTESGQIVEPGHCLEWAWLFEGLVDKLDFDCQTLSDGLVEFARTHGVDESRGVVINEVWSNGKIKDSRARLWPQAERLKAALARYRRTGDEKEAGDAITAFRGLQLYFETPTLGLWHDVLLEDGSWLEQPAPGSSFYHIVCSLSELLRTGGDAISLFHTD